MFLGGEQRRRAESQWVACAPQLLVGTHQAKLHAGFTTMLKANLMHTQESLRGGSADSAVDGASGSVPRANHQAESLSDSLTAALACCASSGLKLAMTARKLESASSR